MKLYHSTFKPYPALVSDIPSLSSHDDGVYQILKCVQYIGVREQCLGGCFRYRKSTTTS